MKITLRCLGLLLVLAMLATAAACGGGGSLDSATPTAVNGTETGTDAAATSSLPDIPLDMGPARTSSATDDTSVPPEEQTVNVLGKDYLQALNATVEGDAAHLAAPVVGDGTDGGGPALAYAAYRIGGLDGRRALSLNIECLPDQLGQKYFVGVADYTNFKWRWFGPATLPEFQLDLRGHNQQFVTQLGNMYFILVCHDGNGALHSQTSVITGPAGPRQLPGGPHHLSASDGLFAGKVALSWQAGAAAEKYDVFRKPARQNATWVRIGESTTTEYTDQPVPDGVLFFYHVRAINANGESARSNPDAGFAGVLAQPRRISGAITRLDGQPVAGVRLLLAGHGEEAICISDTEGKFQFFGLPPGRYCVIPQQGEKNFIPPFLIADLRLQLQADLHFTAVNDAPFHRIWGLAYEFAADPVNPGPEQCVPMAGLTIEARLAGQPDTVLTVTTDEAGFYHFEDLPEGTYLVRAVQDGYGFFPPVHEVVVNGTNRPDRRDFLGFPAPSDGGGDGAS